MSREKILNAIRQNKPAVLQLPAIDLTQFSSAANLQEDFIQNLEAIGGKVVWVKEKKEAVSVIASLFPLAKMIVSLVAEVDISTIDPKVIVSAKELDELDVAVIDAQFGVAENGAVWVSDKDLGNCVIPFIAAHMVVVLNQKNILENMHEAYRRLAGFDDGYGVFIAGPSKTADIEQSLVIGAQGPLSLTLILI